MRYYELDGRAINLDDVAQVSHVGLSYMEYDEPYHSVPRRTSRNSIMFRVAFRFGAPEVLVGRPVPYSPSHDAERWPAEFQRSQAELAAARAEVDALRAALVAAWMLPSHSEQCWLARGLSAHCTCGAARIG